MEKNGNKVIVVIFALMAITLVGTMVYAKIKPESKTESGDIIESKEKPQIKEEIKYINYKEANVEKQGTLSLKITDGTFTMSFNNSALKLTGINEKIKSFTYDEKAFVVNRNNEGVFILLLSENNTIYVGFYEKNDTSLYFKKIDTNLKIKDITTNEIISNSKSSIKTSVVLENDEIRPIIENKNNYAISNQDVSKYEKVYDNLVIHKDGTISTKNNINTKLQYKNQDMIVNRIISVKPEITDYSIEYSKCYYIITNNRLFELCGKTKNNIEPSYFNSIELVNQKTIISTTNLNKGYLFKEMNYEITYDDNTKETIKILSAYIR